MTVNYIYNSKGKPEYAVVPYLLWESLEKHVSQITKNIIEDGTKKFNPAEFKGILKHLDLDLDSEIELMRSRWTRNLS
ncbi:MAG: hypothetical protein V1779_05285 [bacterium]